MGRNCIKYFLPEIVNDGVDGVDWSREKMVVNDVVGGVGDAVDEDDDDVDRGDDDGVGVDLGFRELVVNGIFDGDGVP